MIEAAGKDPQRYDGFPAGSMLVLTSGVPRDSANMSVMGPPPLPAHVSGFPVGRRTLLPYLDYER